MKLFPTKIGLCIFFILCLGGCGQSDRYAQYLNKQIQKHYATEAKEYEFIVVLPRRGCHACIKSSENFFFDTKKDKRFLFIFTRIDSIKKLGLEIGKENLSATNSFVPE